MGPGGGRASPRMRTGSNPELKGSWETETCEELARGSSSCLSLWTTDRPMPRERQRLAKPGAGLGFGSGGRKLLGRLPGEAALGCRLRPSPELARHSPSPAVLAEALG